jgi:hypothetical protein
MLFAAVLESALGTNRTNQAGLTMSVDWGGPEVADLRQTDANDPSRKRQTLQEFLRVC